MTEIPISRRDRKKAATRKSLADAALRLFMERGFDNVGVKEVADAADVSTTTLFKHFPTKEALVFDEDVDREAELVAAVRFRAPGQSIPRALCQHLIYNWGAYLIHPKLTEFVDFVRRTPALNEYGRRMWTRHEQALASAIAAEMGRPENDVVCFALARFALEAPHIARGYDNLSDAIERQFDLIEYGWTMAIAMDETPPQLVAAEGGTARG